ncbi:MAG TPA: hypothetical protein VHE30_08370 [Polyangiaceae bacterium]|nr:hypothetical protein [Polyangiaceae bacterium]
MSESPTPPNDDEYAWAPWAVLVGLVLFGLLGYFGVLSPKRGGPTAADVPVEIPSALPAKK